MIVFPNAKINIGLQVLKKRSDDYHVLETIFYPINIYDVLEVIEAKETVFFPTGISIDGKMEDNICVSAYYLLAEDYNLPPVEIHLHKTIPIGAGLGGGSSDAAFMIKALNDKFELKLSIEEMEGYAKKLGADCAFFIQNKPLFAGGIGTDFSEIDINLSNYHFVIVKPRIHVSTSEAYQSIMPDPKGKELRKAIQMPIENWKNSVINDFEAAIFKNYPEIGEIKQQLYDLGAIYASMSGSGSALYGIFKERPLFPENEEKYQVFYL